MNDIQQSMTTCDYRFVTELCFFPTTRLYLLFYLYISEILQCIKYYRHKFNTHLTPNKTKINDINFLQKFTQNNFEEDVFKTKKIDLH